MSVAVPVLFIVLGLIVTYLIVSVRSVRKELNSTRAILNATRVKTHEAQGAAESAQRDAAAEFRRISAVRDEAAKDRERLNKVVEETNSALSGAAERVGRLEQSFASHRDQGSIHVNATMIESKIGNVVKKVDTFLAQLEEEQQARMRMDESLRTMHFEHSHDDEKPTVHGVLQMQKAIDKIADEVDNRVPYDLEVRTRKANGRFGPSYSFERPKSDEDTSSA